MTATEKERKVPARRRGILAMYAAKSSRTAQESIIADMLRTIGFSFQEQWVLEACGEGMIFDFIIEDKVLVECSYSNNKTWYSAWQVLKRKATFHDYKFRLVKQVGTFTTISLLEAPNAKHPHPTKFPFPQTVRNLHWTDHILTSISTLGEHLIGLNLHTGYAAQSSTGQEVLSRWLAKGTKPKSHKGLQKE